MAKTHVSKERNMVDAGKSEQVGSYRGIPMLCAPGVHEAAWKLVCEMVGAESSCLDLASGAGAWVQRAMDCGVSRWTACELDREIFRPAGIAVHSIDLNSEFHQSIGGRFDLVSCIEIIEHRDSPIRFLKSVRALIMDGGIVLLTTPAVSGLEGRLHFLRTGNLRFFSIRDYQYQRHMSPLTDAQLQMMLAEAGFEIMAWERAGSFWSRRKRRLLRLPMAVLSGILRADCGGDVNIVLARAVTKGDGVLQGAGFDSDYSRRSRES